MKCPDVRENLAACLDGEIGGAPLRAMDEHFAVCPACDAERAAQAAAWALLDRYEEPYSRTGSPSADPLSPEAVAFRARVVERVRREGAVPAGRLLRLPLPLRAAAAAALLAAVGFGLYSTLDRGPLAPGRTGPEVGAVPRRGPEPPRGLIEDMAVLESLDLLQDDDLRLLDRVTGYEEEDLAPFGG